MNNFDMVMMAFRNFKKRKMRSFLTVLGVVIGATSIIIMISLGLGLRQSFMQELKNMGRMLIVEVRSGPSFNHFEEDMRKQKKDENILNDQTIEEFKKIKGVVAATPVIDTWDFYLYNKKFKLLGDIELIGVNPSFLPFMGVPVKEGDFINGKKKNQILLSQNVRFYNPKKNYMEDESFLPMENKLVLSNDRSSRYGGGGYGDTPTNSLPDIPIDVVGILDDGAYSWDSYMDIKELKKILIEKEKKEKQNNTFQGNRKEDKKNQYEMIWIAVSDINKVKVVRDSLDEQGFNVRANVDYVESMQKITNSLQMLLGAVGLVSLFVAAIGIANTMIMSIYERSKEIAVMKVIGASLQNIRNLFLCEAAIIGLCGGMIGIILSYSVSYGINHFGISFFNELSSSGKISVIPIWLALLSLVFSSFIGILFGYFPARRAMHLSVLEALRRD